MTEQKQGSILLGSEYDVHLDLGKRIPISEEPLFDYTKFKLLSIHLATSAFDALTHSKSTASPLQC